MGRNGLGRKVQPHIGDGVGLSHEQAKWSPRGATA
jgi:hypothetical protein